MMPEGKNIAVFCDGTGQGLGQGKYFSNVLFLNQATVNDEKQKVFYSNGVGTTTEVGTWSSVRSTLKANLQATSGSGVGENVVEAYRFLIETYEPGDKIFLFGFSRGAYTVRVLAALLYTVGILKRDQINLAEQAVATYEKARGIVTPRRPFQKQKKEDLDGVIMEAKQLGDSLGARRPKIHFMGCWDTVSTVVVPSQQSILYPLSIAILPYTDEANKGVVHFRHACAVDERRRLYRLNNWKRQHKPAITVRDLPEFEDLSEMKETPTSKQVWFPGWHGDVGAGLIPTDDTGLAAIVLDWMKEEAADVGLVLKHNVTRSWYNESSSTANFEMEAPMKGAWALLELPPKIEGLREWKKDSEVRGLFANTITWAVAGYVLWLALHQVAQSVLSLSFGIPTRYLIWRIGTVLLTLSLFLSTYVPEKTASEYDNGGGSDDGFYDRLPTGVRVLLWSGLGEIANRAVTKIDSLLSAPVGAWLASHEVLLQNVIFGTCAAVSVWFAFSFWSVMYTPLAEPRPIPSDDKLYWTVLQRLVDDPKYRPINVLTYLKEACGIEPNELNNMTYDELKDKVGDSFVDETN